MEHSSILLLAHFVDSFKFAVADYLTPFYYVLL